MVLAAASEFGKRHAQEAILIARKISEGEANPAERLGLSIALRTAISADEAVLIAEMVQTCGFKGATFLPKRGGEVFIYQTDDLDMTREEFEKAASFLVTRLRVQYPQALDMLQPYLIIMPKL